MLQRGSTYFPVVNFPISGFYSKAMQSVIFGNDEGTQRRHLPRRLHAFSQSRDEMIDREECQHSFRVGAN